MLQNSAVPKSEITGSVRIIWGSRRYSSSPLQVLTSSDRLFHSPEQMSRLAPCICRWHLLDPDFVHIDKSPALVKGFLLG